MRFNNRFLKRYVALAPLPLAFERSIECHILSKQIFEAPVLDVGCGEGLFASILFAEKIDVGIDPEQRELDRALQLGAYHTLIRCRGDAIPKPDGYFGTVFSNSVMEHIPDLEPVLVECFRVLRSGGRFYMTVPSSRFDEYSVLSQLTEAMGLKSLQARYRAFYNRFWRHYHFAEPDIWAAQIKAHGFEIVEAYSYASKKVCFVDDLLAPVSLASFIIKRLTNRWTIFPQLRQIALWPATALAYRFLQGAERCDSGGLVFISARKP